MSSFSELVELVNVANPAAQVQLTTAMVLVKSVTHNAPLVQGRDTTAVLSGISSAGVGGDSPVYYNRLSTPTIFAGIDVQLQLSDKPRTRNQMVTELNARYGCDFDPTDFVDSICAANATSYNLEARVDAIKFTGVLAIALVASMSLAELIKVPTLAGFNYPVNEVVGGLRPTKIGDVIFTANSELTLAGNTYQLLSVDKPVRLKYTDWPVLGKLNPPPESVYKNSPRLHRTGWYTNADQKVVWVTIDDDGKLAHMTEPKPDGVWVTTNVVIHPSGREGYVLTPQSVDNPFISVQIDDNNNTLSIHRLLLKDGNAAGWTTPVQVWVGEVGDKLMVSNTYVILAQQVAANDMVQVVLVYNEARTPKFSLLHSLDGGATWARIGIPDSEIILDANNNPLPFFVNVDGNSIQLTNGVKYWRGSTSLTVWGEFAEFVLPSRVENCVGIASHNAHSNLIIMGDNPLVNFKYEYESPVFQHLPGSELSHPVGGVFWGEELHVLYEQGMAVWRFPSGVADIYPQPEVRYRYTAEQNMDWGSVRVMFYGPTGNDTAIYFNVIPTNDYYPAPPLVSHPVIGETVTVPAYPNSNGWAKVVGDPKPKP